MKKLTVLVAVVALFAFAVPALAANPFMDVPMNSWAYDAVSELASQGVISGYPDGTFKGKQPMTRYEMASIVARALAVVDMDKASKQDVEMLKRLVVEFKDELDALNVDVDNLGDDVAALEENLGGWKFWGELRFDSYFADEDEGAYTSTGDVDWKESRFRLWMSKVVDDKVTFIGRVGASPADNVLKWQRFYAQIEMPYEFTAWIGKWGYDWEGETGITNYGVHSDAWFGDQTVDGYYMTRDFSMGNFAFYAGHNEGSSTGSEDEYYRFGAKADFNVTENLRVGVSGLMIDSDAANADQNMYEGNFTFDFTPEIAFMGAYYMEDFDTDKDVDDSPSAFRAMLNVSQEAFGFTSVWLEYASADASFYLYDFASCAADGNGPYDQYGAPVALGLDKGYQDAETDILYVNLNQKWTDKWSTFQRFVDVGHDVAGETGDFDVTNMTFGVKYQYTPALYFELAYDDLDYGDALSDEGHEDDSMVRLRTHLKF